MLPLWRTVEYEDDGVTLYECLQCKAQWSARTSPRDWKFCPECGVKWEGFLKAERREEKREEGWKVYESCNRVRHLHHPTWQIQFRGGLFNEPDWVNDESLCFNGPAHSIFHWLGSKRYMGQHDQNPSVHRAIVVNPVTKYIGCHHEPKLTAYPLP